MSRSNTANRRQLLLVALAALLALLVVLDRFVLSSPQTGAVPAREREALPAGTAEGEAAEPYLAGLSQYSEAMDRPLFSLSRRPPARPSAPAETSRPVSYTHLTLPTILRV